MHPTAKTRKEPPAIFRFSTPGQVGHTVGGALRYNMQLLRGKWLLIAFELVALLAVRVLKTTFPVLSLHPADWVGKGRSQVRIPTGEKRVDWRSADIPICLLCVRVRY
ncbi:uncharacterized protein BDW43DRAFT_267578 [Aspergillus alliaceus]|uniref:uncharacterized protein n=1 Tax=Petromyces alliaceus TaxID=209559 RepID=UPI0012A66573|nr:uncharacterized protein BDW43DRAFT_267578 [Aspergillus alliaceus]KAB8236128.1 hypothetical protein BDW43DRAFT_267578 [Aspergillus alliaceus]